MARYQAPASWRELTYRCLDDARRFRRALLVLVIVSIVIVALVLIGGWPVAGTGLIAARLVKRRRSIS